MAKTMNVVERHVVKSSHPNFDEMQTLSWKAKNLYNATLYAIRLHYLSVTKYLPYNVVNKAFTDQNHPCYRALPAKVSKQIQRLVDQNYRSFFSLRKVDPQNARIPKYLDKNHGRCTVIYPRDALSFKVPGFIKLSKTSIMIPTQIDKEFIRQVRLIPKGNHFVVEVVYSKSVKDDVSPVVSRVASIDLGVNNLATLVSNCFSPIIVNGKPLKSINQYSNKLIAKAQSKKHSVQGIYHKRHCKMTDYLHKASTFIINHLVSNRIDTLIIGKNTGWKQEVKMNRRVKQSFIQIPFNTFIQMLEYKAQLQGIKVVLQEESYTSKASFLSQDDIPVYGNKVEVQFSGKRVNRGLYFDSKLNSTINADVNGAYNIMRKALNVVWNETWFSDCIEVCSSPIVKYTVPFN